MTWNCPPDKGFEIRTPWVWGRARYFTITEAPHNIQSLRVRREETFSFIETWIPERCSNPRSPIFQAGSFNHCTTQQTQDMCITFVKRRSNVFDVGPVLFKCYTHVLCLLTRAPGPAVKANISVSLLHLAGVGPAIRVDFVTSHQEWAPPLLQHLGKSIPVV